jgi:D-alanyl-D-alanine carboxypeptidase
MAMIARALIKEFPDHADLFDIGAIQLDRQIIPNHNGLLGRYPGADGMKTGFTCAAGFNVVASATQNGRRLIVVVLGSPSTRQRNEEAEQLFDRGFASTGGGPKLDELAMSPTTQAPDMHGAVCSRRGRIQMVAEEEDFVAPAAEAAPAGRGATVVATPTTAAKALYSERVHFEPVPVFVGPREGWTGPVLAARDDAKPAPDDGKPADADAYVGEKTPDAQTPAALSAPVALQGAVHAVPPPRSATHPRHRPLVATGRPQDKSRAQ